MDTSHVTLRVMDSTTSTALCVKPHVYRVMNCVEMPKACVPKMESGQEHL